MKLFFTLIFLTLCYCIPVSAKESVSIFRDSKGTFFLHSLDPYQVVSINLHTPAGTIISKRISANACGYAIIRNAVGLALSIEFPQQQVSIKVENIQESLPLVCIRNKLYVPIDFNPSALIAIPGSAPKPKPDPKPDKPDKPDVKPEPKPSKK